MPAVIKIARNIISKSLKVCKNFPCLPAFISSVNRKANATKLTTNIKIFNINLTYKCV